jgi:acetylornithine deacetylase
MRFLAQLICLLSSTATVSAAQFPLSPYSIEDARDELTPSTKSESELLYLHRKLVEIESISGNEKHVGDWLATYLEDHGLTVEKQHVTPDRFNVLAYPGKERKTKILVTSHIDTVSLFLIRLYIISPAESILEQIRDNFKL